MKFVKLFPIDVVKVGEDEEIKRHGPWFPSSFRALVVGRSGCGKTNAVINLICSSNGLRFEHVHVYSKSLQQPKYQFLKNVLESIPEVGYYAYSDCMIALEEAEKNSVIVFDDIPKEDNARVLREFFSRGRHMHIDCFLLCQSYAHILKHLVRDNANFIILFEQDDLNLKHIYKDHVTDLSYEKFKRLCSVCWNAPFGFLVIDKESPSRYRKGFNELVIF